MSGFTRMIAIPQEEYLHLSSMQNTQQPLTQKMTQLQQEYQQQPIYSKNPYEQMVLQGSTLEEMKALKEKIRNDISLGTPKPYRNRALSLYHSIEPVVKFNERGEIYGEDDKAIQDSRAEDLIQHAVRDRRRHFTPIAWNYFLKVLKKYNIPKSALNRPTLEELEEKPQPQPLSRKRLRPAPSKESSPRKSKRVQKPSVRYPSTKFLLNF